MKAETKVFDIRYGWGVSYESMINKLHYPIGVNFKEFQVSYKSDGEEYDDGIKWLSLTEYNLTTGGFTAIDSEPPLEVGDLVYGWDNKNTGDMVYGRITSIDETRDYPFKINDNTWRCVSKEIPQWFIDANK
jgi:hypothetical protein